MFSFTYNLRRQSAANVHCYQYFVCLLISWASPKESKVEGIAFIQYLNCIIIYSSCHDPCCPPLRV